MSKFDSDQASYLQTLICGSLVTNRQNSSRLDVSAVAVAAAVVGCGCGPTTEGGGLIPGDAASIGGLLDTGGIVGMGCGVGTESSGS